jgi:hypothetical protein
MIRPKSRENKTQKRDEKEARRGLLTPQRAKSVQRNDKHPTRCSWNHTLLTVSENALDYARMDECFGLSFLDCQIEVPRVAKLLLDHLEAKTKAQGKDGATE